MIIKNQRQRVSIGMPVYNAVGMLREALESLLSQTYSNFELIVSDNASTDETEEICRDFEARDNRIRYVRQELNRGSTWNFNEVFRLADREYFKWAAYDDLCAPTYLERCVEVLDHNPEIVWVHSRSRHIDPNGQLLQGDDTPEISYVDLSSDQPSSRRPRATRASERPSDRFRSVLLGRGGCLDSYGLIRSSVLGKSQLFLPYFGSEKVLMAELALWGRYYEIPESLFFARIHPAALGSQKTSALQRNAINPLARGRQFPRLRLLIGYCAAVRHSGVGLAERTRCYTAIARYLLQIHKWKDIIRNVFTGGGLTGEYPSLPGASKRAEGVLT